ncbi:Protein prune-like 2 [Acipenser ruthenus]|uniref:Protein prune-like 2 n=1 Tax=Acipenser ruthenus TaxID=7906 RepID=A0A444UCS5_ACIRT|nr:Protein prune-like 2 [Acipenser ruthenus]
MVIDKCNYKMIPLGEHMPSHYQYLVEGSILAVPTSWLKVTLGNLKEKKATCQLKLLCDAFMQPDDCSFRGGISVLQEKYKDVFVTLQSGRALFNLAVVRSRCTISQKAVSQYRIRGKFGVIQSCRIDFFTEDYSNCPSLIGDLKVFNDDHHYEGLVLVATSFQDQQCQQVAVYSVNLELLNQMCCELEEAQNSSLVLEPIECVLDQIQVYKQANPSVCIDHIDQIITLMKEFIDRRQPSIVSNSRTSSTEAVTGSAPLSQRSSGITDMYSSDVEL